jgi:PAS domain S-box-containing protein
MAESNNELFREAFNASPIGIVLENLEGQPLFANRFLCSMLGFSEEELRSKHCVEFSPPEDAEKDWALFQQLRAGSIDHYQLEKRYFRRDGSLVWGRLSMSLLNSRPSPLVVAMVEDITDKRTAEEAVRANEERLRLAQQVAGIGTFERNVQTGVVTWTPEMESLYGLPPGGFGQIQTALDSLIHPDDRARVMKLADCALKTGQPTMGEWRVVWPDGSIHWIAGRWQVFMDESGEPLRVVGANMDVTGRKRTEETLVEVNRNLEAQAAILQTREELLRIFVKHVPVSVAMLDRDMRYLQVSERWCADFGLSSTDTLGRSHYEIFPDLPDRWKQIHRRALEGETLRAEEDRWDRQGGTIWLRWEIRPFQSLDRLPGGILIFSEDITRRKQIDEALAEFPRKLIEAQEHERIRIGRELHDDICQRLAMLTIELQQVQENPLILPDVRNRMGELQQQTSEIAADIQSLSHELHSAKLQYLGIAAAMRGFCQKFGEQQKVEIDFQTHDMPGSLSADTSLCFFRILQESLHNASKHSGVRHFEVRLWGTSDEIHLTVKDSGAGFDQEAAKTSPGLGLISMDERVKMVNGALTIESHSKGGTTIHARVPLGSGSDSMRAAG